MNPLLLSKHCYRICVQRNASRRAILGFVEPGRLTIQINPVPFQAGYLPRTASCCQSKTDNDAQVGRADGNEPICFLLSEPAVPLDFTRQQADFRKAIDPLPLIPRHVKQISYGRQITVNSCYRIAFLHFSLNHRPDNVALNLAKHQVAQVGVKIPTHPPDVRVTFQRCLDLKIPNNRLLPGAFRLESEMCFPVSIER